MNSFGHSFRRWQQMLVFIDESGDTGLKAESSAYFTLTSVVFESKEAAGACDKRIMQLRAEMGLTEGFLFHFAELTEKFRLSFLKAVASQDWSYCSLLVHKATLKSHDGWEDKLAFYESASHLLLNMFCDELDNARITFDRTGGD